MLGLATTQLPTVDALKNVLNLELPAVESSGRSRPGIQVVLEDVKF